MNHSNADQVKLAITGHEMVIQGRLVAASNATLLALIDEDIHVIYKPIVGERPLWDFPTGDLASREVAAYIFSEEAGFHLVPFTVMRDGPFGKGAVQLWIDVPESLDMVNFAQQDDATLRAMALFDAIVNNTDRKFGHILVTQEGTVFGCDHGVTFHSEDKLRTVLWQWAGKELTANEISILKRALLNLDNWGLGTYITETEISALKVRLEVLIAQGRFPFPSQDWPAVPWPPF
jgi:uncharacterized repeat protein (TIGR03843 family)